MSQQYKDWTILTFPTPIGGHMAAIYKPGVTPAAGNEESVTPWWNTNKHAVASAKRKIAQMNNDSEATPEYDPDCPACLRGRSHTPHEHETALLRNTIASEP
jgi:hypothetical protein